MRRKRTVRITIDLPMDFPVSWDNEMIEWHLNEGAYCLGTLIDELSDYSKENGCICQITKCKVID